MFPASCLKNPDSHCCTLEGRRGRLGRKTLCEIRAVLFSLSAFGLILQKLDVLESSSASMNSSRTGLNP